MSRPIRESVMGRVVNEQRHMQADLIKPDEPGQPGQPDHATDCDTSSISSRTTYPDRHGRFKCPIDGHACNNDICPDQCRAGECRSGN